MSFVHKMRLYHAALAVLAALSFITGEFGIVHAWLGYGVGIVIVFRLLWTIAGNRQIGLVKYHSPSASISAVSIVNHPAISKVLMLSVAACLLVVVATGVMMDRGRAIALADSGIIVATAHADDGWEDREEREGDEGPVYEIHEASGNLMLLLVGMHVAYLFTFKRSLARFMLFIPKRHTRT